MDDLKDREQSADPLSDENNPAAIHERDQLEAQFGQPAIENSDRNAPQTDDMRDADAPETDKSGFFRDDRAKGKSKSDQDAASENKAGLAEGAAAMTSAAGVGGALARRIMPFNLSISRRKTVTGGIVGTVLGGGIFFSLSIGSGPLQTIHLGEVLNHSFSKSQSDSANRTGHLLRYARASKTGNIGETRVGILGSKVFGQTIDQLKDIGIEIETGRTGQPTRTTIDTDKLKKNFPELDSMDESQQKSFVADKLGVSADSVGGSGGKFVIDQSDMNLKSSRFLAQSTVALLDDGNIVSAIKARTLTKVLDLPSLFHFFDRTKASLTLKYVNGKPVNEEQAATQEVEEEQKTVVETASGDGAAPEIEDAKSSLGGAGANVTRALTFTGFACQVRGIANDVVAIDRARVALPAIAAATSVIAAGSQVKSGNGMSAALLGALTSTYTDKAGKSLWQSKPLQYLAGGSTKNLTDINNSQRQAFNSHNTVNSINQIVNKATAGHPGVACSKASQILQGLVTITVAGIEEIGSGTTATPAVAAEFAGKQAIQFVAAAAVMKIIDDVVLNKTTLDGLSADAFHGLSGGGLYAYGSRAAANQAATSTGGVMLSNTESTLFAEKAAAQNQRQFESESMFARMFDASDYRSLTGRLADAISPSVSSNAYNFASGLGGIFSSLPHMFASMIPTASADSTSATYNWGFPQVGIPQQLLDDPKLADPYANAGDVATVLDTDCRAGDAISPCAGTDYIAKIKTCFGLDVTLAPDPDTQNYVWDTSLAQGSDVDSQADAYIQANCNDFGDYNWARITMWVNDNNDMKAAACYQGDSQSCQDLGASTAPSTTATGAGTKFRIATFNMRVGTTPAQNQVAVDNMKSHGFQVVGMQELSHEDTFNTVKAKLKAINYDIYPEQFISTWGMNSTAITWDTSKFSFLKADSVTYPAGDKAAVGAPTTSPIVWLQDKVTGQEIIVMNSHTFAYGKTAQFDGPALRSQAATAFTAKVQSLVSQNHLPIFFTGDFNEGYGPNGTAYCMLETKNLMVSPFVDNPSDYCKAGGKEFAPLGAVDHILTSPGIQGTANELKAQGSPGLNEVYANLGTDHKQVPYSDVVVPGTGTDGGTFNISSYNIQGKSHNSGNWQARADDVVNTVTSNNVDIMGGQEMQPDQRKYIVNKLGYDVFPAMGSPDTGNRDENSILWNPDSFTQVGKGGVITGPKYFCGNPLDAAYVELRNNSTSQDIYVINTHDPADAGKDSPACNSTAQNRAERTANAKIYANFIKQLTQKSGLPVFMTGDFNSSYAVTTANGPLNGQAANLTYCIMTKGGDINDAYDVYSKRDAKCPNPIAPADKSRIGGGVDHVFMTNGVGVTGWKTIPGKQAGTDHDFVQVYSVSLPGSDNTQSNNKATSVDGVKNFRDASDSNGVLKPGVLYRSGDLSNITDAGRNTLSQLLGKNGTIIDVRTAQQRQSAPDNPVQGTKEIQFPIQGILDQAPMVTDAARRSQIGKALKAAENAKGAVLIHCSDGKDRTGWLVAMIMYDAGANDQQVMTEYMESAQTFPNGVKEAWLNSGLDAIHNRYGSVNNYLKKGLGLSSGDLQKIRQKFEAN